MLIYPGSLWLINSDQYACVTNIILSAFVGLGILIESGMIWVHSNGCK